jgi:hypothetical protein
MKRDMDLARNILLALEEHEHGYAPRTLVIEGYTDEQIGYHAHLLHEAGLIDASDDSTRGSPSPQAIPLRLTWEGHEFLDAARSDTIWNQAKQKVAKTTGTVSFQVLIALLIELGKQKLGLSSA